MKYVLTRTPSIFWPDPGLSRNTRCRSYRCSVPGLAGFTRLALCGARDLISREQIARLRKCEIAKLAIVKPIAQFRNSSSGGEGGIRTHGTVSRSQHFQCCQFNHSCTSPGIARLRKCEIAKFASTNQFRNSAIAQFRDSSCGGEGGIRTHGGR